MRYRDPDHIVSAHCELRQKAVIDHIEGGTRTPGKVQIEMIAVLDDGAIGMDNRPVAGS